METTTNYLGGITGMMMGILNAMGLIILFSLLFTKLAPLVLFGGLIWLKNIISDRFDHNHQQRIVIYDKIVNLQQEVDRLQVKLDTLSRQLDK